MSHQPNLDRRLSCSDCLFDLSDSSQPDTDADVDDEIRQLHPHVAAEPSRRISHVSLFPGRGAVADPTTVSPVEMSQRQRGNFPGSSLLKSCELDMAGGCVSRVSKAPAIILASVPGATQ